MLVTPCSGGAARTCWSGEDVITNGASQASRDYAESYLPEDSVLAEARQHGVTAGSAPVGAGSGAALRFLAGVIGARHVVEIGTGCGVSALWLLRGMAPDGVLTSVDIEAESQRLARASLTEAGFAPGRFRLFNGRALDVLPRLTDGAYDLVYCHGAATENFEYLQEALRLLRPGGVVAFGSALLGDRVADPSARDPETTVVRELGRVIRDDERLLPLLLPVGDGLLLAIKRS